MEARTQRTGPRSQTSNLVAFRTAVGQETGKPGSIEWKYFARASIMTKKVKARVKIRFLTKQLVSKKTLRLLPPLRSAAAWKKVATKLNATIIGANTFVTFIKSVRKQTYLQFSQQKNALFLVLKMKIIKLSHELTRNLLIMSNRWIVSYSPENTWAAK